MVRRAIGGLVSTLALSLGLVGAALTLADPATAASPRVSKVTLVGTFDVCYQATTTTSAPSTTTSALSPLAPLAPYVIVLLPPPSFVTLSQGGRTVASTSHLAYVIPAGYRNTGHPSGPSGFNMRFTLSAPPGHYELTGIFGTRGVTLVAGHVTRVEARQGDCW